MEERERENNYDTVNGWDVAGGLALIGLGILLLADDVSGAGVADDPAAISSIVTGFSRLIPCF